MVEMIQPELRGFTKTEIGKCLAENLANFPATISYITSPILNLRKWSPRGCPGMQVWSQVAGWPKSMMPCPGGLDEGESFPLQQALALGRRALAPLEVRQV